MKHIITLLILAATCSGAIGERVNTERKVIGRHEYIIAWISGYAVDGGMASSADDGTGVSIIHSAGCTNAVHKETAYPVAACQRTHCDAPPTFVPWKHPLITTPVLTNLPWLPGSETNTWPGTYSTNYVTNMPANVEAP